MIKKGSKLFSIVKGKCPHCQEGEFYEGSFFKATPKDKCEVCNSKYSMEPGFYQGSYYVAYALSVGVCIITWSAILLFAKNMSFELTVIIVGSSILLTSPINYPLSKIIWANFFFHHKRFLKDNSNSQG